MRGVAMVVVMMVVSARLPVTVHRGSRAVGAGVAIGGVLTRGQVMWGVLLLGGGVSGGSERAVAGGVSTAAP